MPETTLSVILFVGALVAGLIGALTGLGGGVVIVPLLTLAFHIDFRYAVGASIVSVIATSSAAAATYVREGFSNIRLGMFLEIATTLGALLGAYIATAVSTSWLSVLFGLVLLFSAVQGPASERPGRQAGGDVQSDFSKRLKLAGEYSGADGAQIAYSPKHIPAGFALMGLAGAISGLLGIGSGAFKVIAMDRVMRVPFKVSTTTSNFMIGVTAAASAGVYFQRGFINPYIAGPVMLGVLIGATAGTRFLIRWRTATLRVIFMAVLIVLGSYMLWAGCSRIL